MERRRIELVLGLLGAVAAAGCARGGVTSSGRSQGVPGATFTVTVRSDTLDPVNAVTAGRIQSGMLSGTTFVPDGRIDCGHLNGVQTRRCSSDYAWGTSGLVLQATPNVAAGYLYSAFAGDCSGDSGACALSGNADKDVLVRFFTARTSHPDFSDGAVHGPAYYAFVRGDPGAYPCTSCHGAALQGQGIAIGCSGCHTSPSLAPDPLPVTTVAPAPTGDPCLDAGVPADRCTTWQPGVTYSVGIPSRTTTCATLDAVTFGNGTVEASSAIQAALDACPEGQVVQLGAGTFLLDHPVQISSGITLRGAGAGQTVLVKTNGAVPGSYSAADYAAVVIVGKTPWSAPDDSTSRNLAADGAKGASSVTVSSAAGFAAGQVVLLDELSGAQWMTDPLGQGRIWAAADWRVVWQLHDPPLAVDDPLTPTAPTGGAAASWFSRTDRPTAELKEIASVSGNTIAFTTPLHISYRTSHAAQLTRYTGANVHVRNAGVEALTVDGASDGAIRFEAAAYSWARNVEVRRWLGDGVSASNSFRVEVRDSYIHDAAWPEPGGGGYALSLSGGTSEALVENSISVRANKVMVARAAGAGSVFGYNYVDEGYILSDGTWIEVHLNASHFVGPHHVLFEGNAAPNFDSDQTHGSSVYHTIFRNQLRGLRAPFRNLLGATIDDASQAGDAPRRCAGSQAYSYWMTFVGNVLGAPGAMTGWVYDVTGPGGMGTPSVWLLGWDDQSPQPWDPNVERTAIRDGNWDWVSARQTWHGSAPVVLPDSLYAGAKPAFFGAAAWPWVDPVTGTVWTLPARARFDAGTPNAVP